MTIRKIITQEEFLTVSKMYYDRTDHVPQWDEMEDAPPKDWEPSCSRRFYCERCVPKRQEKCIYKKVDTLIEE